MTKRAYSSPLSLIVTGFSSLVRVMKNRRQACRLRDLSDTQLEDLGLTRGDVLRALQLSFRQDPAAYLSAMVLERREISESRLALSAGTNNVQGDQSVAPLSSLAPDLETQASESSLAA